MPLSVLLIFDLVSAHFCDLMKPPILIAKAIFSTLGAGRERATRRVALGKFASLALVLGDHA